MAKYLDLNGLTTLWNKIKSYVTGYAYIQTSSGTTTIHMGSNDVTPLTGTSISAGAGLNTTSNDTASDGGTPINGTGTMYLTKSGVTAGNYGPTENVEPNAGTTFTVPYLAVDKYGRVTAASTKTVKMPEAITDTKVNVTLGATTKAYLLGTSTTPTSTATGNTAIADTDVYLDTTAGDLHATTFNGKTLGKGNNNLSSADTTVIPTAAEVTNYVTNQMQSVTGALVYQGTITSESSLLNTALTKGWYYIVNMPNTTPETTSINVGTVECEAGDMIIVKTAGTYTTSANLGAAIDVIQSNIAVISDAEIEALS